MNQAKQLPVPRIRNSSTLLDAVIPLPSFLNFQLTVKS